VFVLSAIDNYGKLRKNKSRTRLAYDISIAISNWYVSRRFRKVDGKIQFWPSFQDSFPMEVNEEFSLSPLGTDPLDGSIRSNRIRKLYATNIYMCVCVCINIYILYVSYTYVCIRDTLEARNERITFIHSRFGASTWQALSCSKWPPTIIADIIKNRVDGHTDLWHAPFSDIELERFYAAPVQLLQFIIYLIHR